MFNITQTVWNNFNATAVRAVVKTTVMGAMGHLERVDWQKYPKIGYEYFQDNSEWIVLYTGILMLVWSFWIYLHHGSWKRRYQSVRQTSKSLRTQNKRMKADHKFITEKLEAYQTFEKTTHDYYKARYAKEIANLKKHLLEARHRFTLAEKLNEKYRPAAKDTQNLRLCIDQIHEILGAQEYIEEFGQLAYNDDEEWPLYRLKERAKELGMNLLSKYRWDSRRALTSAIRSREQVVRIADILYQLDPPSDD
jgi:hypothetical protein